MRIRTKNTVIRSVNRGTGSDFATHTACDGTITSDPFSWDALVSVPSCAREEYMEDSLGKGASHPVHHRSFFYDITDNIASASLSNVMHGRWGVQNYNRPNSWFDNSNVHVKAEHSWNPAHKSSLPPYWSLEYPGVDSVHINDVIERAAGNKADVLLNIVEANQIWPSINSLASCLPEMARNWRELRKVIKTASGAFLAWKFGVSPIISDISSILSHIPKLKSDIQRHKDGDSTRTMKMIPVKLSFANGDFWASPYSGNGQVISRWTHQGRMLSSPCVRFVLVTAPQVRYHGSLFASLDACMRRFVTSPAQLAWELVPFSFVADWFVDLRGVCNAADKMLGFSPYRIKSFTKSLSYHVATDCFTDFYSACNGGGIQSWRSVSLEYKHYDRSVIDSVLLPTINPRLGKNQAAISAALIAQKLALSGARR
jgi:hypothetical protein